MAYGFLPGTRVGEGYEVRQSDAHAWPELYFPAIGWLSVRAHPVPAQRRSPGVGTGPLRRHDGAHTAVRGSHDQRGGLAHRRGEHRVGAAGPRGGRWAWRSRTPRRRARGGGRCRWRCSAWAWPPWSCRWRPGGPTPLAGGSRGCRRARRN
ncbi:MAG: hypothetical protein IPL43_00070 [Micropruina sp.]|nr:hypothetical protein [Micropruina sp.]